MRYQTKVLISPSEAFQRATPQQRATWFPEGPPIPGGKTWGYGGAGPAGPPPAHAPSGDVVEALLALHRQEVWVEALWLGRLVDYEQAGLEAAALRDPYDPHQPPAPSPAAQRHQALVDAALVRSWRE